MPEYMERDEWKFLLADFRAAQWVRDTDPELDAPALLKKFFSIHQFFLRNIGRERPDLFKEIADELMIDVVRKWIVFYRHTLAALQRRNPRGKGTQDLRLAGVNWSEELGITYPGLLMGASHASRYAEFWAEKGLRDRATYASYDERMAFVDSPAYWRIHELANAKQLVIVDQLVNSVTSYDLIPVAAGASGASELRERFTSHGWRTDALDDAAAAELIEIAARSCAESLATRS